MARRASTVSLPLLIALAGVAVVLYQWMGARPLWLDEEMIALNFRDRSFVGLGGGLWLDQSAPLAWLAMQRLVLLVFGSSELALRAIPALFGIATILAALFIGQRWLTTAGCTIFVLLCSVGQWLTFHAVELKPYSGDTFWALCLPALAAMAAEDPAPRWHGASALSIEARRTRVAIWAAAAAIGHWFSLGALLVLPACFLVLALSTRRDTDDVRLLATVFFVVIASFALHYLISIRHTLHSGSLQGYWRAAFPPADAGITGSLRWLYDQLGTFAVKPGGTSLAAPFWISAACGFALAPPRARWLGLAAALAVLSGLALGTLRIVPLYERLSLWMVPALYLGIALLADRTVLMLREKPPKRTSMKLATACVGLAMVAALAYNVLDGGLRDLRAGRPRDSNHETDDRTAIAWLMQERQPKDIVITTHQAQPAIWWYGRVPISDGGRDHFSDGGGIFVAEFHRTQRMCRGREIERAFDGRQRMLVYLGFLDSPPGFADLLLSRLSAFGTISAVQHFAGRSRVAVIDPVPGGSHLFWKDAGRDGPLSGCIAIKRAAIW